MTPPPSTPRVRVLFVCMGNICRSPAAEIVFRHMVEEAGLADAIEIDSAGTIGFHTGHQPDARMAAALKARGYTPRGSARQVCPNDFERFDLILPMDEENESDLRESAGNDEHIRPFVSFCSGQQATRVPDPYYGGANGFEQVADLVEDGCRGLLAHLLPQVES